MKRLTSSKAWEEARNSLGEEPGYLWIWQRLNAIEDILGDDYDLNRLRELVRADRDGRYVILPFRPPKTVYSCSERFPEPEQAHYATAINILWDMDRGCVFGDTPEAAKAALKARKQDG